MSSRPRVWVAAVLSVLSPGVGHLYAGSGWRGLALIALTQALMISGLWVLPHGLPGFVVLALALLVAVSLLVWTTWDAARLAKAWPSDRPVPVYGQWYVVVCVLVGVALLGGRLRDTMRRHHTEAFRLPTAAMTPTLQIGDYLIVDKSRHARQVSRGQVYIFESLEEPGLKVIKRAVAVGGDTVEIQAGQLVRNGQVVSEPYLASGGRLRSEEELARTKMREWQLRYLVGVADSAYMPDLNELGPVVVPTGYFFALGDNRQASYDSRYYGFVPDSLVLGVPSFIYFSRDTLGTIWWRRFGVEPR